MAFVVMTAPSGWPFPIALATHDVGHDVLLLECPEPAAGAAVANLYLVGDGQATGRTHRGVDGLEVSVWQCHAAGVAVERFAEERGRRIALGSKAFDDRDGFGSVLRGLGAAVLAAVGVG